MHRTGEPPAARAPLTTLTVELFTFCLHACAHPIPAPHRQFPHAPLPARSKWSPRRPPACCTPCRTRRRWWHAVPLPPRCRLPRASRRCRATRSRPGSPATSSRPRATARCVAAGGRAGKVSLCQLLLGLRLAGRCGSACAERALWLLLCIAGGRARRGAIPVGGAGQGGACGCSAHPPIGQEGLGSRRQPVGLPSRPRAPWAPAPAGPKWPLPPHPRTPGHSPCAPALPQLPSEAAPRQPRREGAANDDGWNWRKYGEKQVKGAPHPRSYYKCSHPGCPAKKMLDRDPRSGRICQEELKVGAAAGGCF